MFGGWYTGSSGSGTLVTETTKCTGNKTVYALWLTTGGDANWTRQFNGSFRSGLITDSEETWLQMTVSGPGTIGFWWMSSSEKDYDFLTFSVDGVDKGSISGFDVDEDYWLLESVNVAGGGTHTLRWTYKKDDSEFAGNDNSFVRDIRWTVKQYKLAFNANGGTVTPEYAMVDYCKTYDTFPTPTWSGHTFNGWYTARSGGTKVTAPWKCTGNKTIYAQWTAKQYTITFNANGGTVSPASQKVDYCATYTLPTPTWSGHTFQGWYTAKTGGTKVTSPAKCTGNATLYARW